MNEPRIKNPWIRLPVLYIAFPIFTVVLFFYAIFWATISSIKAFWEEFMYHVYHGNDSLKLFEMGAFTDTKNYKSDSPNGKA